MGYKLNGRRQAGQPQEVKRTARPPSPRMRKVLAEMERLERETPPSIYRKRP
jgi:hypothetical protein